MTNVQIITSQHYINEDVVAEKRNNRDYEVLLSPVFSYDDQQFQVILDGHHSLEAARLDGVEPIYIVADTTVNDAIGLLDTGDIETFLEVVYVDGEYIDAFTKAPVW